MLIETKYEKIRHSILPGDAIAFSGKGGLSDIIKWASRAPVSHIGVILQTGILYGQTLLDQPTHINSVIESTSLHGFAGVTINRLSERLGQYNGRVWWLPLHPVIRQRMDMAAFYNFLLAQKGKKYDAPQAVMSALDMLDKFAKKGHLTHNREDYDRFFCSELVAAGLKKANAITNVNASECTPIDICRFKIYCTDYFQLLGDKKEIKGFNSLDPNGWGMYG